MSEGPFHERSAWAVAGMALPRWLGQPSRQAALNRALATALMAAALWGLVSANDGLLPMPMLA